MSISVLEEIRNGNWNYEPPTVDKTTFDFTQALPGSVEKVGLMADRASQGLPLWHPDDRRWFDESENGLK
jgi:hypothetical protein